VSGERRVVVIGGGLAGITAALDCADAGAAVTLVEVRRRLGGAAYSFERDGMQIDNGQHVFMRCCTAYRTLLERLGSDHSVFLQDRLRVPVLAPGRRKAELSRSVLPAPLHMAPALLRYRHLSLAQRLRAARTALALARLDPDERALDQVSFADWLDRRGEGAESVDALWDVIVRPTLNAGATRASLALGAFVFQTALFGGADAGDIGFHSKPLSDTIAAPAERALRGAGVEVLLGWRAEALERTGDGIAVRGSGETLDAAVAVVAVPHARAAPMLAELLPDTARGLAALESSPIVNLHIVYDRRVCGEPFAAAVHSPVQYLIDRTGAGGVPAKGQYLAISLSDAEREMQMSVDALRETHLSALRELLPLARGATVERFLVTREHAATFRAAPGAAALRPPARTSVPGLVLAGAWTDTGWPATLEGAVLSGHAGARVALAQLEPDSTAVGTAPAIAVAAQPASSA
jgi:hydroxysqualene dehydroxylase